MRSCLLSAYKGPREPRVMHGQERIPRGRILRDRKACGRGSECNVRLVADVGPVGACRLLLGGKIEKTIREDSGAQIRDAVDGIRRNGLPTEASWPYKPSKFAQKPDARAMKTAPWHHLDGLKTYRCDGARWVSGRNPYQHAPGSGAWDACQFRILMSRRLGRL
jgi:hypothetical protein